MVTPLQNHQAAVLGFSFFSSIWLQSAVRHPQSAKWGRWRLQVKVAINWQWVRFIPIQLIRDAILVFLVLYLYQDKFYLKVYMYLDMFYVSEKYLYFLREYLKSILYLKLHMWYWFVLTQSILERYLFLVYCILKCICIYQYSLFTKKCHLPHLPDCEIFANRGQRKESCHLFWDGPQKFGQILSLNFPILK